MPEKFLYERTLEEFGRREIENTEIPSYLTDNLNSVFPLRPYQKEAFARFFLCFVVKPTITYTLARLGMQIAFGCVHRKTSPAGEGAELLFTEM